MTLVINDAIPGYLLRSLAATWPAPAWRGWHTYNDANSTKRATRDAELLPRAAWPCLFHMAEFVTHSTAFPDWELHGAGLHEMPAGGHLRRHLDSDIMLGTGWRRELSLVLFIDEWQPEWGGNLVVRKQVIEPQKNRLVIFACDEEAWHEVETVTGPHARRTLSLFFWSHGTTPGARPKAMFAEGG